MCGSAQCAKKAGGSIDAGPRHTLEKCRGPNTLQAHQNEMVELRRGHDHRRRSAAVPDGAQSAARALRVTAIPWARRAGCRWSWDLECCLADGAAGRYHASTIGSGSARFCVAGLCAAFQGMPQCQAFALCGGSTVSGWANSMLMRWRVCRWMMFVC